MNSLFDISNKVMVLTVTYGQGIVIAFASQQGATMLNALKIDRK